MRQRISFFLISLFLILATYSVYNKVLSYGFINLDDDDFITENRHVQNGLTKENIIWAFTTGKGGNWNPVTWLSHIVDGHLYGLNPGGHHLSNLLLHILNTLLLFYLLVLMTKTTWTSALVALFFALHPLHVESVAWVAERKDVLSTFFWLLTIGAYFFYTKRRYAMAYLSSLFFFCLGLMAKPMLVTLPVLLLLFDYWPLYRWGYQENSALDTLGLSSKKNFQKCSLLTLLLEKAPFFGVSFFWCFLTFSMQKNAGAVSSLNSLPLTSRLLNALLSYNMYLWKTLWPRSLAILYPFRGHFPLWQIAFSFFLLAWVSFIAFFTMKKHPYFLVGWLWYLISLIPVIGLIQVGLQSMADRYTYVPIIGIFIMIAWGLKDIALKGRSYQLLCSLLVGGLFIFWANSTRHQIGYWKSSITLFEHALKVTENNFLAHNNLGVALASEGRLDAAIWQYKKVLEIDPEKLRAHNNLGVAYTKKGDLDIAKVYYLEAVRLKPDYAKAHFNLGVILAEQGNYEEAITYHQEVVNLDPKNEGAHYHLGRLHFSFGHREKAIFHYKEALKINPQSTFLQNCLSEAIVKKDT